MGSPRTQNALRSRGRLCSSVTLIPQDEGAAPYRTPRILASPQSHDGQVLDEQVGSCDLGLAPPTPAATDQQQNAKQDQEAGPQDVALQPTEKAEVLEEVIGADENERRSPEPRPHTAPTPSPWTVPTTGPLIAHLVPLLPAPGPPFITRSSRSWRLG